MIILPRKYSEYLIIAGYYMWQSLYCPLYFRQISIISILPAPTAAILQQKQSPDIDP